jgi:hypothetical protein
MRLAEGLIELRLTKFRSISGLIDSQGLAREFRMYKAGRTTADT